MPPQSPVALLVAILVVIALAAPVFAAKMTNYNTSSLGIVGVNAPLVELTTGANSGVSDHVASFSIGTNRTTFSAQLRGYGGASTVVTDLFHIVNVDGAPHAVVLTGTQVTNAQVTTLTFEIFDGAASKGVLNLKSAGPTLDLGSMPAGKTYTVKMDLKLAVGAGGNNVNQPLNLVLRVTP